MSTVFFERSKEIADGFLQSIVFLDDKAFGNNAVVDSIQNNSQHEFDSSKISKVFAKEKKICAVYTPMTTLDIADFKEISKKADVVILDWFIEIPTEAIGGDLTDDVQEEDPRGQYTKQIINELISTSGNAGLKLIIVYTGEDILDDIANDIYGHILCYKEQFELMDKHCEIRSPNIRILVRAKYSGGERDTRFSQRPHLRDKVLRYEDLPCFILNELTSMTSGLLSNFALLSLTTIRNNSHKILSLFSKELDAAYMGHKALLPLQNDSEDLLLKLFGDTISDLLHYASISQQVQKELIDAWIDSNIENENISLNTKTIHRTQDLLKTLLHSDNEDIEKRFEDAFRNDKLNKSEIRPYRESKTTELFLNLAAQSKKDSVNLEFARLTHYKSLFIPQNVPPKLTLGTIVKSSIHPENYYVCIQQRCDSVRLKIDEERKFLFLPLTKTEGGKFQVITPEGIKLVLDKKSYSMKTIKFKCNCAEGEVKGNKNANGKYIFSQIYDTDEKYEWVLDLKDLHSQRIVTNYVSSLARVGLDESEWLRIAGN